MQNERPSPSANYSPETETAPMGRSPGEFLRAMPKSDQDTVRAVQPTSVRSAAVEPGSSHALAGAKSLPSRADEAEPTTPVAVEANGNPALGGAGPSASKSLADITAALACLREAWNLARKHRDTIGDAQLSEAIQGMLLDMVEHDTLDLQAIAARIKELAKQVK